MKTKLLLIFAFISHGLLSQSFELTLPGSATLINGTEITITGVRSDMDVQADIVAKNVNGQKTIKVRKREMFYGVTGQNNAICWGSCSAPVGYGTTPVLESDALILGQGGTTTFNGHVYPNNTAGNVKFRYVWFDVNNPTDTAFVDVVFEIAASSSIEEVENKNRLTVFPNPLANGVLNVKLEGAPKNNQKVVITDILGKVVYGKNLGVNALNINASDFKKGIYFVSLREGNNIVFTEKVIITK